MDGSLNGIVENLREIGNSITQNERDAIYDWYVDWGMKTNQPIDWFMTLYVNPKDYKKYTVWFGEQKLYGRLKFTY